MAKACTHVSDNGFLDLFRLLPGDIVEYQKAIQRESEPTENYAQ